jgi:MIP family channel proteins
MRDFMRACAAEATGTFFLVFVGAGSICMDSMTNGRVGLPGIAIAHGLALSVAVTTTLILSGGHLNPAVTFGHFVTGRMDRKLALGYMGAQILGGCVAGLCLRMMFEEQIWRARALGTPDLDPSVTTGTGILVEAVLTFLLVFAFWATVVDGRGPKVAGFGVGLTLTACMLAGGALTGASLNPARSFGPALASGHWSNHLVYWIGPFLGAALAAWFYDGFLAAGGRPGSPPSD